MCPGLFLTPAVSCLPNPWLRPGSHSPLSTPPFPASEGGSLGEQIYVLEFTTVSGGWPWVKAPLGGGNYPGSQWKMNQKLYKRNQVSLFLSVIAKHRSGTFAFYQA